VPPVFVPALTGFEPAGFVVATGVVVVGVAVIAGVPIGSLGVPKRIVVAGVVVGTTETLDPGPGVKMEPM
jgi:hypothetical protein